MIIAKGGDDPKMNLWWISYHNLGFYLLIQIRFGGRFLSEKCRGREKRSSTGISATTNYCFHNSLVYETSDNGENSPEPQCLFSSHQHKHLKGIVEVFWGEVVWGLGLDRGQLAPCLEKQTVVMCQLWTSWLYEAAPISERWETISSTSCNFHD